MYEVRVAAHLLDKAHHRYGDVHQADAGPLCSAVGVEDVALGCQTR